jgi:serine/threonine protein kinase/DNA-binding beta-propeller fold protein YncE
MATQPGAQGEFRRPQDQQSTQPPAESQKLAGGNPPNEQSEASRQAARPSEKEDTLTSLEEDSLQPPGAGREPPPEVPPPEKVMQVAQYRTVKKIGKGGMGVVYLADDLVLNRKVAIKFAHTPALPARFQREAEITALLEHPGVVPVLMRGQQDGRLYYVMRYVEGERFDQAIHSWHESCQSARDFRRTKVQLQFRELLQRFVAVCQTVAYAHSRGIIHRDLKPSNILLGRFGETIVLDWGLARRKSVDGDAGSPDSARPPDGADDHHTRPGAKLGTEAYMAPEQVDGKPADERTDVFLLGATLYHLLTGQPPFCLGRPAKPPRQLKPWIPAALQAICRKAMADDPQARYPTAEQLAADVKRWLADEPVAVYREPLGQRLARWLRRQGRLAGAAAVSMILVLTLTVGFSLLVATRNHQLSQTNRDLASALDSLDEKLKQTEEDRRDTEQRLLRLQRESAEITKQLAAEKERVLSLVKELEASRELALELAETRKQLAAERERVLSLAKELESTRKLRLQAEQISHDLLRRLDETETRLVLMQRRLLESERRLADAERLLWLALGESRGTRLIGHERAVNCVAVTPDGRHAVSGSSDMTLRVWDLASAEEVRSFTGHQNPVLSVAVTPDGKYVVSGGWDRTVRLWDLATGKEVQRFTGHAGSVWSVAVTPDGKCVVSGSGDKTVRLWSLWALLLTEQEVLRFTGHESGVSSVAVTPDGKYVVSGSCDKTVRLWDLATGKEVRRFTGHESGVSSVAVTPDGKYIVSGSEDKTVRLWQLATGEEVRRFTGHESGVSSVAVTPDGKYIVSGSEDKTVRLWDLARGKEVRRFSGHQDRVTSVTVTPDGRSFVSGSADKTVRVWYIADLK